MRHSGIPQTTKPTAFRLPDDIIIILERRAKRKKLKLSEYLKRKTIYDALRSHKRKVK